MLTNLPTSMSDKLYIFTFEPVLKTKIWGGDRIARYKHIADAGADVGESWEVSAVPGSESVVSEGHLAGRTLSTLCAEYGKRLVGTASFARYGACFPLLVKLIDANSDLSIQVHPDDSMARAAGKPFGKTEMWYVIESAPDATIRAGFNRNTSRAEVEKRVSDLTLLDVVNNFPSRPGEFFYLPAGCIHAIGAGNFLLEIQQSIDLTYRVYDYDRIGKDGQRRPLQLQEALAALNYDYNPVCAPIGLSANSAEDETVVCCPYFQVSRLLIDGVTQLPPSPGSFRIFVCTEGSVTFEVPETVASEAQTLTLPAGSSALVPAEMPEIRVSGRGTVLLAGL